MNKKPVSYLQNDSKWKNEPYKTSKESATIGSAGCGPTTMAMIIATWVDPSVTPVDTCNWAMQKGYKATGNGTYHSYFVPQAKAYGLECERINTTAIKYLSSSDANEIHQKAHDYIDEGHLVVCLMGKGNWTKGGHYILWYSNDGDDVLINDPASTKSTRVRNKFSLLKSEVGFYWVVKVPKEVISMTNSEVKALIADEVKKAMTIESTDPSSWAAEAWKKAHNLGIIDGTNPKGHMTREQVIVVLDRLGLLSEHMCRNCISIDDVISELDSIKSTVENSIDKIVSN